MNIHFIGFAILAAFAQIIATYLLVTVLKLRNFSMGTTFAKTEAIFTAVLGFCFFSQPLGILSWSAIALGVFGTILSGFRTTRQVSIKPWTETSLLYGIGAGLGFGLASLWLREASLALQYNAVFSAATTLLTVVCIQTLVSSMPIWKQPANVFGLFLKHWKTCVFVGFTSAMGSVGWFTAITLQSAAIVKGVGQIEFVLSAVITLLYFRENISSREWTGMILVTISVLMLLLSL